MWLFNFRNLAILLTLVLVTVSTLVAVTAYSSTTVTGPAEITIVSTDQALLALSPGIDYGDIVQVEVSDQKGVLQLSMSFDFQNEQQYTYEELFRITNNSANTISLNICSDISYITEMTPSKGILNSGETVKVKVVFFAKTSLEQGAEEGFIKVEANAIN